MCAEVAGLDPMRYKRPTASRGGGDRDLADLRQLLVGGQEARSRNPVVVGKQDARPAVRGAPRGARQEQKTQQEPDSPHRPSSPSYTPACPSNVRAVEPPSTGARRGGPSAARPAAPS